MRVKWPFIVLVLLLFALPGQARSETAPKPAKSVKSQEKPSAELLEFLGTWETAKGEFIDPTELDRIYPDPKRKSGKEPDLSDILGEEP